MTKASMDWMTYYDTEAEYRFNTGEAESVEGTEIDFNAPIEEEVEEVPF